MLRSWNKWRVLSDLQCNKFCYVSLNQIQIYKNLSDMIGNSGWDELFPEGDKVEHDEAIDALWEGRGEKAADAAAHRVAHADATL